MGLLHILEKAVLMVIFIAYCRNNLNDNFTCYNDAGVSKVGVTTAMEAKISKHEIEKKTPYILLYHYMK